MKKECGVTYSLCEHDIIEREVVATTDGMCPICMKKKIEELEGKKKTWFEKMVDEHKGTPLFEAESKILELEEENCKLNRRIEKLEREIQHMIDKRGRRGD